MRLDVGILWQSNLLSFEGNEFFIPRAVWCVLHENTVFIGWGDPPVVERPVVKTA